MFGVVPRLLWERVYPPDEKNRILLGMNVLVIQTPEGKILVDNGVGGKLSPRLQEIYSVQWDGFSLLPCKPEEIDLVVLTHLHFDHCGGSTTNSLEGTVPAFPRATYFVQETEWLFVQQTNERTQASYFPENYQPLMEQNCLQMVKGEKELLKKIYVIPAEGHTPGHQIVVIYTSEHPVAFMGDLVPTTRHIPLPYIMAYDLFPLQTLETRKIIYRRAIEEHWLMVFEHDDQPHAGFLQMKNGKYQIALKY